MDEQQLLEALYPEPRPLDDSSRAAMREELFGPFRTAASATGLSTSRTNERRQAIVSIGSGASPHRRRVALAAAVLGLVGVGGLWAASARDTVSQAPAQQPSTPQTPTSATSATTAGTAGDPPATLEPTAFPVVDEALRGLPVSAFVQRTGAGWTSARTEMLIARRIDGVLADAVRIEVWPEPFEVSPMQGRTPVDAVVLGQDARVFDRSQSGGPPRFLVTWGTGPFFVASGEAPLTFLDRARPDAIGVSSASGAQPPQIIIGSPPEGFDVIVEPQVVSGGSTTFATLSIGIDNFDINVQAGDPLLDMASSGYPLRAVDVNGRPGWTFLSSAPTQDITWQVDDSTYAYLKVNDGSSADEALAFARQITFVDFETWSNRYSPESVEVPTSSPATSTPDG